jgi:hypothetical protein
MDGRRADGQRCDVHTFHGCPIEQGKALPWRQGIPQENARTRKPSEHLERFLGALRGVDFVSGALQQFANMFTDICLILDDENGNRHFSSIVLRKGLRVGRWSARLPTETPFYEIGIV